MIPMFDEKRVFMNTYLRADMEEIKPGANGKDKQLPGLDQIVSLPPSISPPSGLIHYFRWGSKDVFQLSSQHQSTADQHLQNTTVSL